MKKVFLMSAVLLLAVLVIGGVSLAYAQDQNPPFPGFGPGMMGGNGFQRAPGMMGQRGAGGFYGSGEYGPIHEYMIAALAGGLDLTVEDLQARLDAGENPYQIAEEKGLSAEEIQTLFQQAHETALAQAVADGVITQEQADWMSQHMGSMGTYGYGRGMMGGGRGGATGFGMMGGFGTGNAGPIHDYQIAALAGGLDLTVEDLQARLDAGETPYQIAEEKGLSLEEYRTLANEAHAAALEQAVADGVLTPEQAEWMNQRMGQGGRFGGRAGGRANGSGFGPCHGTTQP